jgi:hypothetical protein
MEVFLNKKRLSNPYSQADSEGVHNKNLEGSIDRLLKGNTYKDLSTVWLTPTRGTLTAKVVANWMGVMKPMNQPFIGPVFVEKDEVGFAYQKLFDMVLEHPDLKKWKYILTVEEDNLPPQDGILKLYESIADYDCVAGLYWTKGEAGQPMIYGDPTVVPRNFTPQLPRPETVQHCNGLGMGFNLWKVSSFDKLKNMPKPWFKTVQDTVKGSFTQDLWFFNEAAKYGFKVACDTRVKVGHLDINTGMVW